MHQPRNQLKNVLFLFAFNVSLAEFTSMLWVIILHEYKSLNHKQCSRWDCEMLQYAVITGLIQFALPLIQNPDFVIEKSPLHHNRVSSMPDGCRDTRGCSSFTNSSPHIDFSIWLKSFKLIHQSKGLYPTVLLSSHCEPWPTGAY